MIVVYRSNTGFTQQYAQMLGQAEKLKVYSVQEARLRLPRGEDVLFMGPLVAGHIAGIDEAVKRYCVKGACGVGMSPPSGQVLETLAKANYVKDAPIFYLQGGWAPQRVGWLKRRMVGMVTRSIRKELEEKGTRRTAQEQEQLEYLIRGGSYVAFENLEEIRSWLRKQH